MKKGFTLIEVLVVMALVSLISLTVLPIGVNQVQRENVVSAAKQFVDNIQLMQEFALSRKGDEGYGLKIESGGFYIFKGSSYATATEIDFYNFANSTDLISLNIGGGDEIIFPVGEIEPSVTGQIVIGRGDVSYTIDINAAGNVQYYRN